MITFLRISIKGGTASSGYGGGGAGGRISTRYHNSTFQGLMLAQGGGNAYEAGGAGTIILQDVLRNENHLYVNNKYVGAPHVLEIDYEGLRGRESCRTWLPFAPDGSGYHFVDVDIQGLAHLVLYKEDMSTTQMLRSDRSSGDGTGYFHIGPLQVGYLRMCFCCYENSERNDLAKGINFVYAV